MPATDFIRYCADCDLGREAMIEGAESEAERDTAKREHPRVLATKSDIDGTPLCARCLEYRREDRRVDLYERQLAEAPEAIAAADAAFEEALGGRKS